MRVQIPLVVEMTDEQVADYAADFDLPSVRAKDVVTSVQGYVLTAASDWFDQVGSGATVTIKGR